MIKGTFVCTFITFVHHNVETWFDTRWHVEWYHGSYPMLIPNCTSGKDVYILPRIPLTEGVGQLGP